MFTECACLSTRVEKKLIKTFYVLINTCYPYIKEVLFPAKQSNCLITHFQSKYPNSIRSKLIVFSFNRNNRNRSRIYWKTFWPNRADPNGRCSHDTRTRVALGRVYISGNFSVSEPLRLRLRWRDNDGVYRQIRRNDFAGSMCGGGGGCVWSGRGG